MYYTGRNTVVYISKIKIICRTQRHRKHNISFYLHKETDVTTMTGEWFEPPSYAFECSKWYAFYHLETRGPIIPLHNSLKLSFHNTKTIYNDLDSTHVIHHDNIENDAWILDCILNKNMIYCIIFWH